MTLRAEPAGPESLGPEPVVTSLGEFLASDRRPLGVIQVAGADLAALIAAEADPGVLRAAARRAAAKGDRCWQIALGQRLQAVAFHPGDAATLCGWQIEAGRIGAAQATFAALVRHGGIGAEVQDRLRLRLALAEGRFAEVAESLSRAPFDLGHAIDAGWAFLQGGGWSFLPDLLARIRQAAPQAEAVSVLDIRCRSLFDGPLAALALLEASPDTLVRGTVLHAQMTGQLLQEAGRFSEALDVVDAALVRHPTAWALYGLAESLAAQADRTDRLEALLERAIRLFPEQPQVLVRAVNLAADTARMAAAEALLPRLRMVSEWGWHEAQIVLQCQGGDRAAIDAAYQAALAAGLPAGPAELGIAGYHFFFKSQGDGLDRAASLIAPLSRLFAHDSGFQCLRLRLMVARGQTDAALVSHAALPAGLAGTAQLAPFRFLADVRQGRAEAARKGWAQHLARSAHIATNARSALPAQVALKWDGGAEDILLFAVIFNGIEFTDWFLDHYRKLGVNHFFFVDNGSTDGTFEMLASQPDVSLFRQPDSFRAAGCGIFWINHLIRRFGVGHWCFQVDMDEAFVFPNMERGRSLRDFLSFIARQGWASVPAMMLDIYPEVLGDSPGANGFAASRFYDIDYTSFPNEIPPYRFIQGGVRARLSGRSLMMTKAPLVRPGMDFAYLANNHQHTHLPISDVTGVLLHYKFIGNLLQRVDEAIDREEHFMGARFYRSLRDPLDGRDGPIRLRSEFSRAYASPDDLVQAGLMHSSPAWDHWPDGEDRAGIATG